jgi:DHA2 family multidrug resistance protein
VISAVEISRQHHAALDLPHINPWLVAIAVMVGTFMEVLDTTITNVALPQIAGNLSASVDESTWILTSYLVSNAVVLPLTGWLSNYFGRKRLLIASVAGFTLSSLACGLAPSLPFLILFRVIQGAAGGGLQPLSQAILLEAFPPEQHGKAMAFWGIGILVAPLLGPVAGGWIVDNYSWRWIFYINIPLGVIAIVLALLFVFDPPYIKRNSSKIDYWGIGFLALGVGALQIVLDKGQEEDWFSSHMIMVFTAVTVAGLSLFLIREFSTEDPVVDLRVFRYRNFAAGVLQVTVVGVVLYGTTVLIPLFLQTIMGYPAVDSGIATLPRGWGSIAAMAAAGFLVSKMDGRLVMFVGFLIGGWSTWALGGINLAAGQQDLWWPQFFQGISMGFIFVPLTTLTYDRISQEELGNATAIFNLLRNIGGSIGISFVTTMIARNTQVNTNILGEHVTLLNPVSEWFVSGARGLLMSKGQDYAGASTRAYAIVFGMIQRQAWLLSFNKVVHLLGILFFLMIPFMLLMRKPSRTGGSIPLH